MMRRAIELSENTVEEEKIRIKQAMDEEMKLIM